MIQIDIDPAKLGKRHKTDVAVLADAGQALKEIRETGVPRPVDAWLQANRQNRLNWNHWLKSFQNRDDFPLRAEPVFKEINRIAKEDAVFVTDVGNVTVHAVRLLDMNFPDQLFTTSGLFATMGYGVPGGIAAALNYPGRQVFTISGDGGFAMVMQDIVTQVKYRLPVINIILSNDAFGFIEAEQEDTRQPKFGITLQDVDFARAAEAMGARGFRVTRYDQLRQVFDQAAASQEPVVIDVKVEDKRPFPAEAMVLDTDRYTAAQIGAFQKQYEVRDMPLLREIMAAQNSV